MVNVSWHSTEPLTELEGYVLATLLRLTATGKIYRDRKLTESPKTGLTEQLVRSVAGPFAFIMAAVGEKHMTTISEVDVFMRDLGKNLRRAEVWLNAHGREQEAAQKYLGGLVGKFTCTG